MPSSDAALNRLRTRKWQLHRDHFGACESALLEEAARGMIQSLGHDGNAREVLPCSVIAYGFKQVRTDALIASSRFDGKIIQYCNPSAFSRADGSDECCHRENPALFTHHKDVAKVRLFQCCLHAFGKRGSR